VIELGRIPGGLKGHLRHADRVRVWACGSVREAIRVDSVVHVRLVVGAVEVLAIPAWRKVVGSEDATRALLSGHIGH